MTKNTDIPMMGVSGSIPVSLYEAMQDKRWDYRVNMSQFVRMGLESWAQSIGIWTPDEPVIDPDDPELTDDQRAALKADQERAEAAQAELDAAAKAEAEAKTKAEADAKTTSRSRK